MRHLAARGSVQARRRLTKERIQPLLGDLRRIYVAEIDARASAADKISSTAMLLHLVLTAISLQDSTVTYAGRAKRIQIDVPRIDTFSPIKQKSRRTP